MKYRNYIISVFLLMVLFLPVSLSGQSLKIGILPDADSLPLMIARDKALYRNEGVQVELVSFTNPQERDAAFMAGRIDGAISDLLAAAFFAAGGFDVRITSSTDGRYGIVASRQSGIQSVAALRGRRIGLSTNTIIQYTVDSILAKEGLDRASYRAVAVPQMPVRMELLVSGALDAAGLPEPLLTAAVQKGAVLIAATDRMHIDAGVLLFSKAVLDRRLEDVRAFYRAYAAACELVMADPELWRPYLVENAGFPVEVRDAYEFVPYRKPQLPDKDQLLSVFEWLRARQLLQRDLDAAELLDARPTEAWN